MKKRFLSLLLISNIIIFAFTASSISIDTREKTINSLYLRQMTYVLKQSEKEIHYENPNSEQYYTQVKHNAKIAKKSLAMLDLLENTLCN